ncbi:hypothetical protein [uncultured Gammaproteobacteria bacterium]|jgi:uncharacterized protein with ParB-like and HNH nuclease domain|nr:hypothetical protein [uncultured Gammaproteobacteria bacterium]CAC9956803.1 hypothetical protein [uncultured Gammaproteobacteria bacterium]
MTIHTDHKNIIELITGDLTQFHVPIYQRNYTWGADKEVKKLIDDIIEFGQEYQDNDRAEYYIGNIIIKNQTRGMITERIIIDGQQRITTSVLILCAIRDIYRDKYPSNDNNKSADIIQKSLYQDDNGEVKLKLNNMENQKVLSDILSGEKHLLSHGSQYQKNYDSIRRRFTRIEEKSFYNLVQLLNRIKVVIIILDEDQDENSVFESINSTGKPLSGSDLIKNYLFTFKNYNCSHDEETALTRLYTEGFEGLFKNEKKIEVEIESFFRIYIAIQTSALVKKDAKVIYYKFKELIGQINSVDSCKKTIADLSKWANIYQSLKAGKLENINSIYLSYIKTCFELYGVFLIQIVEKYSHIEGNKLVINNTDKINKLFKVIIAYDASRIFANFPTAELVRWAPMLLTKNHLEQDDYQQINSYADRFVKLVTTTDKGYRQPNKDELKKSAITLDLYTRNKKYLKRILILLENTNKNELLNYEKDLKSATIEHIMPQTLSPEWSDIDNEEHKEYLHTLGNLTLTFDNSKLSNLGFNEKKQILKDKSKLSINVELAEYPNFDIEAIKKRANSLLDKFFKEYLGGA